MLALTAGVIIVIVGAALGSFDSLLKSSPPLIALTVVSRGDAQMRLAGERAWQPLREGSDIPSGAHLRTGAQGGIALQLRNGTSIRVSRDSDLALESAEALRLDGGMVYIDTGANPLSGALRIATPIGVIHDVGTIFEVKTTHERVRVRVREGHIYLEASGVSAQVEGRAGEEVEVDRRGDVRRRALSPQDAQWRWADALAVAPPLEGLRLLQFLAWVAHQTGRRLEFQEPAIEVRASAVVLHGKATGLAPLDALDFILSTTDLEYVLPSDEVIVIRTRQE
jgi:ferric-dicitrate binding protein FerR (iron transport regulator)